MIKSIARTLVQQWLDDPSAQRWSATNIDYVTQFAIDQLWADILDISPYYNSFYETKVSSHSPGYIDLRQTSTGDLTNRLYKLQSLVVTDQVLYQKDPRDYLKAAAEASAIVSTPYTYELVGDRAYIYNANGELSTSTSVGLRYSYLPASYVGLADGTAVEFPDGDEIAFILYAAALAMAKGSAEDATQLMNLAQVAKNSLLNRAKRRSIGPTMPFTVGTAEEFGG